MGAEVGAPMRRRSDGAGTAAGPTGSGPLGRRATAVDRLLWALAAVPTAALLLLASMVLRVRLADGAWPTRNAPDPKTLGLHNSVSVLAIVVSFVVAAVVPLATAGAFAAGHRRVPIGPLLTSLVSIVILVLVLWLDPGGIGQWIAD
ncbi:MAG: hypothetical protein AAGA93_16930 [Actinomycetota bacterium]